MTGRGRDGQRVGSLKLRLEKEQAYQLMTRSMRMGKLGWMKKRRVKSKAFKKLKIVQIDAEITKNADKSDSEETK